MFGLLDHSISDHKTNVYCLPLRRFDLDVYFIFLSVEKHFIKLPNNSYNVLVPTYTMKLPLAHFNGLIDSPASTS